MNFLSFKNNFILFLKLLFPFLPRFLSDIKSWKLSTKFLFRKLVVNFSPVSKKILEKPNNLTLVRIFFKSKFPSSLKGVLMSFIFNLFKVLIFFWLLLWKKIKVRCLFAYLTILEVLGIFSILSKIILAGELPSKPEILHVRWGLSAITVLELVMIQSCLALIRWALDLEYWFVIHLFFYQS